MRRPALTATFYAGAVALSALLLVATPRDTRAGRVVGQLPMSVVVLPFTRVTPVYQAPKLRITPDDIARAYVEVRTALVLRVQSNHRRGHRLVVEPTRADFRRLEVLGLGEGPVALGGAGGAVALPRAASGERLYTLGFRLFLPVDQAPGDYDWPLSTFIEPR
jgi:hypothetical protein